MTRIISNLAEIAPLYDAVFCDLWGCLHNGVALFPSAVAALRSYRAEGGQVILVTNAPRPKASVIAQLAALGLPEDAYDDIATSGDAAQFGMLSELVGRNVYHIGAEKDEPFFNSFDATLAPLAARSALKRVPLEQAEGVICTGLVDDLTETPEDYHALLHDCLRRKLPMLCVNPDIVADFGDKRLWCAGALADYYAQIGGEVVYFGKPHAPIYDLSHEKLRPLETAPRILCIGDGIHTDVLGGIEAGLDTLFITQGIAAGAFGSDPLNPAADLLERWLAAQDIAPTYAIGFLR